MIEEHLGRQETSDGFLLTYTHSNALKRFLRKRASAGVTGSINLCDTATPPDALATARPAP